MSPATVQSGANAGARSTLRIVAVCFTVVLCAKAIYYQDLISIIATVGVAMVIGIALFDELKMERLCLSACLLAGGVSLVTVAAPLNTRANMSGVRIDVGAGETTLTTHVLVVGLFQSDVEFVPFKLDQRITAYVVNEDKTPLVCNVSVAGIVLDMRYGNTLDGFLLSLGRHPKALLTGMLHNEILQIVSDSRTGVGVAGGFNGRRVMIDKISGALKRLNLTWDDNASLRWTCDNVYPK